VGRTFLKHPSARTVDKPGGLYFLQLFDHYVCSGNNLLLLSVFQSIAIGWIYGAENFYDNIEDMIGFRPGPLMKICWRYVTPIVCFGTFVFSIVRYQPLKFNKTYVYPTWAYVLGWCLGLFCVLLVPLWMVYKLIQMNGTIGQVREKHTHTHISVQQEHESCLLPTPFRARM
uniref:Sodium-and chloride-dependent GABA transporter 2 n=1 Tax=Neogobius melanostomus TaxID=47308 RepID=A0A8C6T642_9GOBI